MATSTQRKAIYSQQQIWKIVKKVSDCDEKLLTLLSGKTLELFEKRMKANGESGLIHGREYFMERFRLGARIALEIMDKSDGCIIDIIG